MEELLKSSVVSLAKNIREKRASSVEIVETYLRRIEEVNPALNAVVQLRGDAALSEARAADESLAKGEVSGPLHGVPFTVKDSLDTAGIITAAGTTGRATYVPDRNATVVSRVLGAGGVMLGKTNCSELTSSIETDNFVYGRTNNPYGLDRTPGGSSGGPAAIVAAGGSPLEIGTDSGGSIRVPCHFCGIAGIKPTSGRVPRTGDILDLGMGAQDSLGQVGPMARYVEDLILALPILSGPDWIDPAIVPMHLGVPGDVDVASLRVAWYADDGVEPASQEIADVIAAAAEVLAGAGASVTADRPEALPRGHDIDVFRADGNGWLHRLAAKWGTKKLHPHVAEWADTEHSVPVGEFTSLLEELDRFRSDMLGFWRGYDVIICPVTATPAFPHNESLVENPGHGLHYVGAFNLTGWPGAVVRGGTSAEGLPIGVQIVAPPWREEVALAVALRIESALAGWQPPPL